MADARRFIQISYVLGWSGSDADTNPDSGRKCNSDTDSHGHPIVRARSNVKSGARVNIHVFERHLSVERRECDKLLPYCRKHGRAK